MRKSLVPLLLAGALMSLVACLSTAGEDVPLIGPDDRPCFVGGCSGQLCTDRDDIASTCEWREEYACYRTATCERQDDGACGWTETPVLRACLGPAA